MSSCKQKEKQKWTKEAILCLIEAYKEEPCLYAVNTPNYHNKHLRSEALKRVCAAVSMYRPETVESECTAKFHNLRNQFNIENKKINSSIKSGIGTNDIYKPSLWYFEHLQYIENYFMSRKSRNSLEKNFANELISNQNEELSNSQQLTQKNSQETFLEVEWLDNALFTENSIDESTTESFLAKPGSSTVSDNDSFSSVTSPQSISIPDKISSVINISRPSPSISPANSTLSGVSSRLNCSSPPVKLTKKRKANVELRNDYTEAIESLADSLKQPIVCVNSTNSSAISNTIPDPVDTCMIFIGSILKGYKNEKFKFEIMNKLVQIVIDGNTQDLETAMRD